MSGRRLDRLDDFPRPIATKNLKLLYIQGQDPVHLQSRAVSVLDSPTVSATVSCQGHALACYRHMVCRAIEHTVSHTCS